MKKIKTEETLGGIAYSRNQLYKIIIISDHRKVFEKINTVNIYGWGFSHGGYQVATTYTPLKRFLKRNNCVVNELGDILYQSVFKIGVLR